MTSVAYRPLHGTSDPTPDFNPDPDDSDDSTSRFEPTAAETRRRADLLALIEAQPRGSRPRLLAYVAWANWEERLAMQKAERARREIGAWSETYHSLDEKARDCYEVVHFWTRELRKRDGESVTI